MDLQLINNAPGFSRWEGLRQGRQFMGIQVVHDQHKLLSFRKMKVDQVVQTLSEINHRPLVRDFDMTPSFQRGEKDKQMVVAQQGEMM